MAEHIVGDFEDLAEQIILRILARHLYSAAVQNLQGKIAHGGTAVIAVNQDAQYLRRCGRQTKLNGIVTRGTDIFRGFGHKSLIQKFIDDIGNRHLRKFAFTCQFGTSTAFLSCNQTENQAAVDPLERFDIQSLRHNGSSFGNRMKKHL